MTKKWIRYCKDLGLHPIDYYSKPDSFGEMEVEICCARPPNYSLWGLMGMPIPNSDREKHNFKDMLSDAKMKKYIHSGVIFQCPTCGRLVMGDTLDEVLSKWNNGE